VHHERAVGELHPLAHRREADPAHLEVLARLGRIEPLAVVRDLQSELTAHASALIVTRVAFACLYELDSASWTIR